MPALAPQLHSRWLPNWANHMVGKARKGLSKAWHHIKRAAEDQMEAAAAGDYDDPSACPVNDRVGHVSATTEEGHILVWGGYKERPGHGHDYWPTNELAMRHRDLHKWRLISTQGQSPRPTSGATAAVVGDTFYVFCGFCLPDEDEHQLDSAHCENVNSVHALNLSTFTWITLATTGTPPMRCDKLASWTYQGIVYLHGGFGPPDNEDVLLLTSQEPGAVAKRRVKYQRESTYGRGWNDQLVCYVAKDDRWEWMTTSGEAPGPRAAHAAAVDGHYAFVFGGRYGRRRTSQVYRLDLLNLHWIYLQPSANVQTWPVGRSWHTLTSLWPGKMLLYGGYDSMRRPLRDAWLLDTTTTQAESLWNRAFHLDRCGRLWHTAPYVDGEVFLIGGVRNDLLDMTHPTYHPKCVDKLTFSPLTLTSLAAHRVSMSIPDGSDKAATLLSFPPHLRPYLAEAFQEREPVLIGG